MRGGALPAGLLCAVVGLMLAFLPPRIAMIGAGLLAIAALAANAIDVPAGWTEPCFLGCWVSLVACAACIYLPRPPARPLAIVLAANAGIWAGLVLSVEGQSTDLWRAVPAVAIAAPGAWLVRKGYSIAPRVVTSWLLAVALIAAVLPTVVVHPGYIPDHMG